jgi:hypothetical protein
MMDGFPINSLKYLLLSSCGVCDKNKRALKPVTSTDVMLGNCAFAFVDQL